MSNLSECVFKITSNVINLDEKGRPDGDVEKDEFVATGTLKLDGNAVALSYKEKREGSSVSCDISVKDGDVTVSRRGDVVCDMLFSLGKTHKSTYTVPPFSFDMEIDTVKIDNTLAKEGGALSLLYNMNIGGAQKRCRMKIERKN